MSRALQSPVEPSRSEWTRFLANVRKRTRVSPLKSAAWVNPQLLERDP